MPTRPPTFSPSKPNAPTHKPREADRQATRALNTGSKAWRLIRQQVLVRDGYRCQACQRLVVGREAHVDHIDGDDSNNPTDGSNWQTLCANGHSRKTWAEQHGRQWDGRCEVGRDPASPGRTS